MSDEALFILFAGAAVILFICIAPKDDDHFHYPW